MRKRTPPVLSEPQRKYLDRHRDALAPSCRETFVLDVLGRLTGECGDQALMSAIEASYQAAYAQANATAIEEVEHEHATA